eukprot:1302414-Amphidinium_carterae.1
MAPRAYRTKLPFTPDEWSRQLVERKARRYRLLAVLSAQSARNGVFLCACGRARSRRLCDQCPSTDSNREQFDV